MLRSLRRWVILAFAVIAILVPLNGIAAALDGSSTWLDTSKDLQLSVGGVLSSRSMRQLEAKYASFSGLLKCTKMTVPTAYGYAESGCWYKTKIGLIERGGYVIKPKGKKFANGIDNYQTLIFPTPHPDTFVQLELVSDENYTFKVEFRTADNALRIESGSDWYHFAKRPSAVLKVKGKPYIIDDNTAYNRIGHSSNGNWLTLWDERGFIVAVNLVSFAAKWAFIAPPPTDGYNFSQTSISDNGRYASVLAYDNSNLGTLVLDFDSCGIGLNTLGMPTCAMRFINPEISNLRGEPTIADEVIFRGNDLLEYYTFNLEHSKAYRLLVRAPNTWPDTYIALGDSYASGEGEGNSNFYPATDVHDLNMCHLARNSYPFLLGKELNLKSTHSVACSGARIINVLGNGVFDRNLENPNRTNQYKQVSSSLGSWLPGFYQQIKFVKETRPSIITISAGGNDIGFKDIVERCLGPGTCYDSYEDRLELVRDINSEFNRLVSMYKQIKAATIPDAHIYVIGYPSIIKSGGDCGWRQPLDFNKDETQFANQLVDYLDSIIELAASKAGVSYVDTSKAFIGHRLCEGSARTRAVNGVTVGSDSKPLGVYRWLSNGSFHPDVYGHKLLADTIRQKTNDFTESMPLPDNTILNPVADDSLKILQKEKSGRPVYEVVYLDVVQEGLVYVNSDFKIAYKSNPADPSTQLRPNSPVTITIHSKPTVLGKTTTDQNGDVSLGVTLPSSIEPGIHSIDLFVMGVDGKMHDITQTIYVATRPASDQPVSFTKPVNVDHSGMRTAGVEATKVINHRSMQHSPTYKLPTAAGKIIATGRPSTLQKNQHRDDVSDSDNLLTYYLAGSILTIFLVVFLCRLRYARAK